MQEILKTLDEQLQPRHTALVVIDMQNDFCAEGGYLHQRAAARNLAFDAAANARLADRIATLVDAARRAGAPVVWVRAVYDFKYRSEAFIAKGGEEGLCMEGSWGVDFFRLRPEPGDPVVTKHSFNGFHDTNLHAVLMGRGIRTLLMTGVATNVCVDSTLREGFFLGYHIVLVEDCVGSGNQAGHEGTLTTVRLNFGTVLGAEEAAARLLEAVAPQ